jgi:hypothetical protein
MTTPAMAVRSWLAADAAVAALAGARVYQLHLPQSPDYPAVVVQTVSEPVPFHLRGPAGLTATRVQVDAYAEANSGGDGKYTVDRLAAAIDRRLDGEGFAIGAPPLAVTGAFRQNRVDLHEGEEVRLYRVMQEYLIWSRPQTGADAA